MEPLTWLYGEWKGTGSGEFPTMDPFEYDNLIRVRFLEESFEQEPLLHFEEIAWVHEPEGRKFKHWETGFFKSSDDKIQFYVSHNTGRIEVTYGELISIDPHGKSFELELTSDFIRNEVGLKATYKSHRKIALEGDIINYSLELTTEDVSNLSLHLTSTLKKTNT